MSRVRILLNGLVDSGRIYAAGDVVDAPSPRLLELAHGDLVRGQVAVELLDDEPSSRPAPRKKK